MCICHTFKALKDMCHKNKESRCLLYNPLAIGSIRKTMTENLFLAWKSSCNNVAINSGGAGAGQSLRKRVGRSRIALKLNSKSSRFSFCTLNNNRLKCVRDRFAYRRRTARHLRPTSRPHRPLARVYIYWLGALHFFYSNKKLRCSRIIFLVLPKTGYAICIGCSKSRPTN